MHVCVRHTKLHNRASYPLPEGTETPLHLHTFQHMYVVTALARAPLSRHGPMLLGLTLLQAVVLFTRAGDELGRLILAPMKISLPPHSILPSGWHVPALPREQCPPRSRGHRGQRKGLVGPGGPVPRDRPEQWSSDLNLSPTQCCWGLELGCGLGSLHLNPRSWHGQKTRDFSGAIP